MRYQIQTDTDKIWINGVDGLIARFSKTGIDIHGQDKCLDCQHKFTDPDDWEYFCRRVKELHDVDIKKEKPDFNPFDVWVCLHENYILIARKKMKSTYGNINAFVSINNFRYLDVFWFMKGNLLPESPAKRICQMLDLNYDEVMDNNERIEIKPILSLELE